MHRRISWYVVLLFLGLFITLYLFNALFGIKMLDCKLLEVQMHNTYFVFAPWQLCIVLYGSVVLPIALLLLGAKSRSIVANSIAVLIAIGLIFCRASILDVLAYYASLLTWMPLSSLEPMQRTQIHSLPALIRVAYILQGISIALLLASSLLLKRHLGIGRRGAY